MGEHIPKPIKTGPATWLGFILMCLGMFMAILDIQVVATSLPNIQEALSISQDAMSWIQTSYLLAEIIAIPLSGWTTRVLTLRWLFVTAICVFTLSGAPSVAVSQYSWSSGFLRASPAACSSRRSFRPYSCFSPFVCIRLRPRSRGLWRFWLHRRSCGRRLDQRDLVLAVAIPDQCRARDHRRCCLSVPVAPR